MLNTETIIKGALLDVGAINDGENIDYDTYSNVSENLNTLLNEFGISGLASDISLIDFTSSGARIRIGVGLDVDIQVPSQLIDIFIREDERWYRMQLVTYERILYLSDYGDDKNYVFYPRRQNYVDDDGDNVEALFIETVNRSSQLRSYRLHYVEDVSDAIISDNTSDNPLVTVGRNINLPAHYGRYLRMALACDIAPSYNHHFSAYYHAEKERIRKNIFAHNFNNKHVTTRRDAAFGLST